MVRSVRIHEFGGPKALRTEEVEIEKPGEGEVRIRIRAIGINRTEITPRSGRLPAKPPLPGKIGFEAAGEIEAIGAGVKGFAVGDRVALAPTIEVMLDLRSMTVVTTCSFHEREA